MVLVTVKAVFQVPHPWAPPRTTWASSQHGSWAPGGGLPRELGGSCLLWSSLYSHIASLPVLPPAGPDSEGGNRPSCLLGGALQSSQRRACGATAAAVSGKCLLLHTSRKPLTAPQPGDCTFSGLPGDPAHSFVWHPPHANGILSLYRFSRPALPPLPGCKLLYFRLCRYLIHLYTPTYQCRT